MRHNLVIVILMMGFLSLGLDSEDRIAHAQPADAAGGLVAEPKTVDEALDAVVLMLDIARPNLARQYLEKMLSFNPSDDDLLKLRDDRGPAIFLRMANVRQLQPVSVDLLNRVNAAFRKRGSDPVRIDGLIRDLDGTPEEQVAAIIAIRSGGAVAVPRILQQVQNPSSPVPKSQLLLTLTKMGPEIIPPLIGGLDSPDREVKTICIEALGWMRAREAVPFLYFPAFSSQSPDGLKMSARTSLARIKNIKVSSLGRISQYGVIGELESEALSHFKKSHNWTVDPQGKVEVWGWDPNQDTVSMAKLEPQLASLYIGTQLARQAMGLAPSNQRLQGLYLAFLISGEIIRNGWDKGMPTGNETVYNVAITSGEQSVETALVAALEHRNSEAALGALQILGDVGSRSLLDSPPEKKSPLIQALDAHDPRVQFAAANAILKIDPHSPFRGSARVMEVLTQALSDNLSPRAIVCDANLQRATQMSGFLAESGYDVSVQSTGRGTFLYAAERADVELILLNINCVRWPLSQTIANLRADSRTANLPIMVYGPDAENTIVNRLMRHYRDIGSMLESRDSDSFSSQLRSFVDDIKGPRLTIEQRRARSAAAIYWLAEIANGQRTRIFDLATAEKALSNAVNDSTLANDGIVALSSVPTRTAQQRLMDVSVNPNEDAGIRETAALNLSFHIQRYGLLLTEQEANSVKDAQSAAKDTGVATALATVVGTFKPDTRKVNERLQEYRQPPLFGP